MTETCAVTEASWSDQSENSHLCIDISGHYRLVTIILYFLLFNKLLVIYYKFILSFISFSVSILFEPKHVQYASGNNLEHNITFMYGSCYNIKLIIRKKDKWNHKIMLIWLFITYNLYDHHDNRTQRYYTVLYFYKLTFKRT